MDLSLVLAACFISLVGLPHGALDPVIARRVGLVRRPNQMLTFLIGYSLLVALVIGLWLLAPAACLSAFLLASALHFGRDWQRVIGFGGWAYGALVLSLPLIAHSERVTEIFAFLVFDASPQVPVFILAAMGIAALILFALDWRKLTPARALELTALVVGAVVLEPLWFFVGYFCALHSPRHLRAEFQKIPETERLIVFVVMLFITILTLAIAAFAGSHLEIHYEDLSVLMYQLIFIGLAALTVPHMALLEWVGKHHGSD